MKRSPIDYFESELPRILDEWKEFLRFRTVSNAVYGDAECARCAKWLVSHLQRIGFQEARIIETKGKPLVYAFHPGFTSGPSTLYYGHYDVYEPGRDDEWITPPFEPDIRNGRMYARGAEDNKGQSFFVLKAAEYLLRNKQLAGPLKILLEGEEETTTSESLFESLPRLSKLLESDQLLVCDTDIHSLDEGSIVLGLRGILHIACIVHGANRPLHSGVYGGIISNPASEAARLLSTIHACDGSISVPNFLDGLLPPTLEELQMAALSCPSNDSIFKETGFNPLLHCDRRSMAEKRGFLPTIELNAMRAGVCTMSEVQTTIPAIAEIFLTARLVAGQSPERCLEAIERHLVTSLRPGFRLEVLQKGVGGPGFRLPTSSPAVQKAAQSLETVFHRKPTFAWEGMSVPVLPALLEGVVRDAAVVGFGLDDDNTHGPNESFSLDQFRLGFLFSTEFLGCIEALPGGKATDLEYGAGI